MNPRLLTVLTLALITGAGCAPSTPAPTTPTPSAPAPNGPGPAPTPEQRLRAALARDVPDTRALDSLSTQFGDPRDYHKMLASIATDTTVNEVTRGNAYIQLGKRYATDQAGAFALGITDPSVRVRASTAAGLSGLLAVSNDSLLMHFINVGMHDRDDRVQAKALESVGDGLPDLLRVFLAEQPGPSPEIRALAQQLLTLAEDRGAALVPAPDGSYTRSTSGVTLRYEPRRSWPHWEASAGILRAGRVGAAPDSIAADVEVVNGVVPAFVSKDGRHLVYESARKIYVYELSTRTTRVVGDGVAPRAYPFLDSFLYLRERRKDRAETANGGAQLFYDVMRVPFSGGEPAVVAQVSATTQLMLRGAYSPVRWMRVRESTGAFMIEAEGMANTILPDPFATKTEP
jgi:hypothetical protein